MQAVRTALRALAEDRDFQEDLRDEKMLRAIKHWTGIERLQLSEEEGEEWAANPRLMGVLQKLRRLQAVCRSAGTAVPLDLLLAGRYDVPDPAQAQAQLQLPAVVLKEMPAKAPAGRVVVSVRLARPRPEDADVHVSVRLDAPVDLATRAFADHLELLADGAFLETSVGDALPPTIAMGEAGVEHGDVLVARGVTRLPSMKQAMLNAVLQALSLVALAFVASWVVGFNSARSGAGVAGVTGEESGGGSGEF